MITTRSHPPLRLARLFVLACSAAFVLQVRANYPVVRFRNGTVGVRSDGEVHVQSDEFLVNGHLRVSGSLYVNDTDVEVYDVRVTNVENTLGIDPDSFTSCYSGASAANFPSALTHWIDFSNSYYEDTFESGAMMNSAVDIVNNASGIETFGDVEYMHGVHLGNGAAFFNDVNSARGVRFGTTKLGKNPEIIIAYNQIGYMEKGVILGDYSTDDPSYQFGTRGTGNNKVGMSADNNANMGTVEADFDMWHAADVYYGNTDGFLNIDNDPSLNKSFSISGRYDVDAMSEPHIGGVNVDSEHMHGLVGEVLYFNQRLSPTERESVMAYMMEKWIDGSSASGSTSQCSTTINEDGSVNSPSAVVTAIAESIRRLTPMACEPPGGARLYFNGDDFVCECNENYVGESCTDLQDGR